MLTSNLVQITGNTVLHLFIKLTDKERGSGANVVLGSIMAMIAGAVNAGGFLAVQQYTSHMTGVISGMADDLVVSDIKLVLAGAAALIAFLLGAATTAIFINWARRRRLRSEYALSLALEALLLLAFGLLGANLNLLVAVFVPTTVLLLCFIMGLQNAIMTKVSKAEIRTTHMTGIVTDIGIELGRLLYWNKSKQLPRDQDVRANRQKLKIHLSIFVSFLSGGILGAIAFKEIGYLTTVPIACFLILLVTPSLWIDTKSIFSKRY